MAKWYVWVDTGKKHPNDMKMVGTASKLSEARIMAMSLVKSRKEPVTITDRAKRENSIHGEIRFIVYSKDYHGYHGFVEEFLLVPTTEFRAYAVNSDGTLGRYIGTFL